RQRIESDIGSIDLLALLRSLQEAAERRDLQIYLKDPAAAEVLSTTGWDGHLDNSLGQDYLLVVDMSLGFNKVSAIIDKQMNYHVTIPDAGQPTANLLVRYTHQGEPSSEPCKHGTIYTADLTYSDMFEDCYWNYVRVYVPQGSELLGSSSDPVDPDHLLSGKAWEGSARVSPESNDRFTVFDSFYLVEQGQQVDGEFFYAPPSSIVKRSDGASTYSLEVAKQAGIADHPLSVWVTLPEGAEILNTDPEPSMIDGNQVVFDETLVSDMFFEVVYR
ncbi:MAG: hypothetical protein ACK2T3_10635, partial [Candidatus Promineifilaceae bacterium]